MSEKTKEVPKLANATYAYTLVIKSTHEYKVHGADGSNLPNSCNFITLGVMRVNRCPDCNLGYKSESFEMALRFYREVSVSLK